MEERLRRFDEPVLLEMEAYAEQRGFPIVGRNVGVTLEVLARSVGAARVMELGSGFGRGADGCGTLGRALTVALGMGAAGDGVATVAAGRLCHC